MSPRDLSDAMAAAIDQTRAGFVPAHVYNDRQVHEEEMQRIFGRTWIFVAHESELAQPHDYVVRHIAADSLLVTRDGHGVIHVMFNMCVHRGMQVCRAERGNASTFRCPYHAWTYRDDGTLAGVPFHLEAYGGDDGFVKSGQALVPAPAVAIHNGLIFAALSDDVPPFEEWLGDFAFYLDFYTRPSPAGIRLLGPQRWRIRANWKIGAENFAGDSYHTPHTHASVVDIRLFGEPKPNKRKEGVLWAAGPAAGTTYKLPAGGDVRSGLDYVGYPAVMVDRMLESWDLRQQALVGDSGFMPSAATLFPNLSFVHNWPAVGEDGVITPFTSLRVWQPIGPDETEVLSWFAVAADAPEDFAARSYRAYLLCFGSSGMFEQDDVENWVSITTTAGGSMARRVLLNNRMGLDRAGRVIAARHPGFAGPGDAFQGYGEYGQRHWYQRWAEHLERPLEPPPAPIAFGLGGGDR